MPSPSDHHGNPCTSRHGVVSCVLPCPASMATANLPNSSVDDNLQDFLLLPPLLPLFLPFILKKKNPFIPVKCDSDLVPYDNRFERNAARHRLRTQKVDPISMRTNRVCNLPPPRDYIYISTGCRYTRINIEYLEVTIHVIGVKNLDIFISRNMDRSINSLYIVLSVKILSCPQEAQPKCV